MAAPGAPDAEGWGGSPRRRAAWDHPELPPPWPTGAGPRPGEPLAEEAPPGPPRGELTSPDSVAPPPGAAAVDAGSWIVDGLWRGGCSERVNSQEYNSSQETLAMRAGPAQNPVESSLPATWSYWDGPVAAAPATQLDATRDEAASAGDAEPCFAATQAYPEGHPGSSSAVVKGLSFWAADGQPESQGADLPETQVYADLPDEADEAPVALVAPPAPAAPDPPAAPSAAALAPVGLVAPEPPAAPAAAEAAPEAPAAQAAPVPQEEPASPAPEPHEAPASPAAPPAPAAQAALVPQEAPASPAAPAAPPADAGGVPTEPPLELGARVALHGLSKLPELNGCPGVVQAWDEAAQRWEFASERGGKRLRVRSRNLRLLAPRPAGAAEPAGRPPEEAPAGCEAAAGGAPEPGGPAAALAEALVEAVAGARERAPGVPTEAGEPRAAAAEPAAAKAEASSAELGSGAAAAPPELPQLRGAAAAQAPSALAPGPAAVKAEAGEPEAAEAEAPEAGPQPSGGGAGWAPAEAAGGAAGAPAAGRGLLRRRRLRGKGAAWRSGRRAPAAAGGAGEAAAAAVAAPAVAAHPVGPGSETSPRPIATPVRSATLLAEVPSSTQKRARSCSPARAAAGAAGAPPQKAARRGAAAASAGRKRPPSAAQAPLAAAGACQQEAPRPAKSRRWSRRALPESGSGASGAGPGADAATGGGAEGARPAEPRSAASPPATAPCQALLASGHTLRPDLLGQRIVVIGDGWGGRAGAQAAAAGGGHGYEAVVTEADDWTLTVIPVSGAGAWQETHVLREFCVSLDPGPPGALAGGAQAPAARAPKVKRAVKPESRCS